MGLKPGVAPVRPLSAIVDELRAMWMRSYGAAGSSRRAPGRYAPTSRARR